MKSINLYIKKSLSVCLIIVYLIFRLIGKIAIAFIDLNDISGWPMKLRASGLDAIFEISFIVFFLTYLILDIKKIYRNIKFSKIHLVSVAICAVINNFVNIEGNIYFGIVVASITVFLINLYISLFARDTKPHTTTSS